MLSTGSSALIVSIYKYKYSIRHGCYPLALLPCRIWVHFDIFRRKNQDQDSQEMKQMTVGTNIGAYPSKHFITNINQNMINPSMCEKLRIQL